MIPPALVALFWLLRRGIGCWVTGGRPLIEQTVYLYAHVTRLLPQPLASEFFASNAARFAWAA